MPGKRYGFIITAGPFAGIDCRLITINPKGKPPTVRVELRTGERPQILWGEIKPKAAEVHDGSKKANTPQTFQTAPLFGEGEKPQ
jgi:hypothetical protein